MTKLIAATLFLFVGLGHMGEAYTASPGDLDASFGNQGKVVTLTPSMSMASAVTEQSDKKIIAVGGAYDTTFKELDFIVVRYNPDGILDTSFDGDGIAITPINRAIYPGFPGAISQDVANAVALQEDGKIVVVGRTQPAGMRSEIALVRYNTDGSLDTTFDKDGIVTTTLGSSGTIGDNGRGIAIQPDGKILVAGTVQGADSTYPSDFDFALVRYNPDGSLDNSFNGNGKLTIDSGLHANDQGSSLVLSKEKIFVGGNSFNGTNDDFALLIIDSNGKLLTKELADFSEPNVSKTDVVTGLRLDDDRNIVLVGTSAYTDTSNNMVTHFAAVRFKKDGSLDTKFGKDESGGKLIFPLSDGSDLATSVAIQPNGKIVIGGWKFVTRTDTSIDKDFVLLRLDSKGILDGDFGTNGEVVTDFEPGSQDQATAIIAESSGKIVVAGSTSPSGLGGRMGLARYIGDSGGTIVGSGAGGGGGGGGAATPTSPSVQNGGETEQKTATTPPSPPEHGAAGGCSCSLE